MWISKVKLDNYVSFYETPEFELRRGMNFVVGKIRILGRLRFWMH